MWTWSSKHLSQCKGMPYCIMDSWIWILTHTSNVLKLIQTINLKSTSMPNTSFSCTDCGKLHEIPNKIALTSTNKGCKCYLTSKDTLLIRICVVNVHDALQDILSITFPMNLHSTGKDISPLVILKSVKSDQII